jgi:ribosomal protein L11 methylase PrmA
MAGASADRGSFRDPSGTVYRIGGRILRTITDHAEKDFAAVVETGLLESLVGDGSVVGWHDVDDRAEWPGDDESAVRVLEHPVLPFISYPYEWSFRGLKAAALLHLDIHLKALEFGCTLLDASAYNVQFQGPRPIFIDHLSFRPYTDGDLWIGHSQFCDQFLAPLLLRAVVGVAPNAWFRGAQEGVPAAELAALLPWWRRWRPRTAIHITMPAAFERRARRRPTAAASTTGASKAGRRLPKSGLVHMLNGLRRWIGGLEPRDGDASLWSDYDKTHSYASEEESRKMAFVERFVGAARPTSVWDVGCNTGVYSALALSAGAGRVIGFEFDHGALDKAFARATDQGLDFLPLYMDAANPSPSQGWNQEERPGLAERGPADGLIALAVLHHLCIGRNIPLPAAVDWLVGLAPTGVIEFVPKTDPMVQVMLAGRQDVFDKYDADAFESAVAARARIGARETVTDNGRLLVTYDRS